MVTLGLSAVVSASGVSAPSYADILTGLQTKFREIYGSDIYIEADSQDGQMLALIAAAINDCNDVAISTYNAFAPGTAQGVGLSSVVKTNGIARLVASKSTAVGLVVGQSGTVITGGQVKDANGNLWDLPATVTIPPAGETLVTVTAQNAGEIDAAVGTINKIMTPTLGWQTFASTVAAVPGAPVESDAVLRERQTVSTAISAITPLAAMIGALSNLAGVQRVKIYENVTKVADTNGIPGNAICVVIQGGDVAAIAETIGQKKTPGADTYGTTSQSYVDPTTGISYLIKFFILAESLIKIVATGTSLTGYTTAKADAIKAALAESIGAHTIGETVEYSGLWGPAYLNGPARAQPYRIDTLTIAIDGNAQGVADIPIAFNAIAACTAADVTVTIV